MLDSSTLHSATIEERGILFWSAASSDIKMPNGLAAIAATIIMIISRIRSTAQPPRAAMAEPTALRVYNKVCKLEKVAYTLFNLREV